MQSLTSIAKRYDNIQASYVLATMALDISNIINLLYVVIVSVNKIYISDVTVAFDEVDNLNEVTQVNRPKFCNRIIVV